MTKTSDCLYIAVQVQVVKAIWVYAKEHNLQDPKNKRKIICDEKLGKFLPARTDMFKMNKELSKHVFTQGEAAVLHTISRQFCRPALSRGDRINHARNAQALCTLLVH